jgi:hypothetical protein
MFLLALRGLALPAAFEVLGTTEGVSLQITVRAARL